jgi:hypothetical protein
MLRTAAKLPLHGLVPGRFRRNVAGHLEHHSSFGQHVGVEEVDVRVRAHTTERHAARRGFEGDFERVTTDPLEKMKAVVKQEGLARGNAEGRIIVQSKPFG